ncbi:MAG: IS91 family transposase [Bacteroidetes bacterium]|nr:IS91 family transposase [Bacteroidota bacterium]
MQTTYTVQKLLQQLSDWKEYIPPTTIYTLEKLKVCRTPTLGYHLYACNEQTCSKQQMQYHSCRNRHCPNCGGLKKEQWVEDRTRELLPCTYYHVVFTVPHQLGGLFMGNQKALYNLLFESSAYMLKKFSDDKQYMGAQTGIVSILHTWGQQLSYHPHVHCIVTGGGLNTLNQWVLGKKTKYRSLYPVKAMQVVYRARMIEQLKAYISSGKVKVADKDTTIKELNLLYSKEWIVYAKQPFGGPQQVIEYLGRYTHKVAISNHRIKHIDESSRVTFEYKNYSKGGQKATMTLEGKEFIRRFSQHILPKGLFKIRSYGIYTNYKRTTRINEILKTLKLPLHPPKVDTPWYIKFASRYGKDPLLCPCCKKGKLELVCITYKQKPITINKRE